MNWGERGNRGRRLVLAATTALCVLAATVAIAFAEDPSETTTFGKDGIAAPTLGFHFRETSFASVEARPDGGLIAQRGERLETYLPNGAPDPASPPRQASPFRRVFPLAAGKSLVATGAGLTRVNPDGSTDSSFGDEGTIKTPFWVTAARELPTGQVLVAGTTSGGTHEIIHTVTVGLVNPDGSITGGLGTNGYLTLPLPSTWAVGNAVEIVPTPDGGSLVVGSTFLLELRADGSPNPRFGADGLVTELPKLVGARVLPDGAIQAVGSELESSEANFISLRLTPAGRPDDGFGTGGVIGVDLGAHENANVASWEADGSVVVGGASKDESSGCSDSRSCVAAPVLVGFDPEGHPDAGFGVDGALRLGMLADVSDGSPAGVLAMTRRPDGSIVAAGGAPPGTTVAFLAALTPEGTLLPGFGDGGVVRVRYAVPALQLLAGIVRLPDGKLLAGGTTDVGTDYAPVLIRYNADGSLDRSFGAGTGYVPVAARNFASGFAVDAAGQALIGTYDYPFTNLELRAADGGPVPSFGVGGTVRLPRRLSVEDLAFGADGGAIVAGTREVAGDAEPGVVLRFRPNGQPDRRFGNGGSVALHPGGAEWQVQALAAGTGGKLIVGGMARRAFTLTALRPNGRPDHRFGSGGWRLSDTGGVPKSVALKRVGSRIYLAGVAVVGDRLRVVLLRFGANGQPDPKFGRNGRMVATISKTAKPTKILPTRRGVLVVLSRGPRPLLFFRRDGQVRRRSVGGPPRFVSNVRATRSGGRLILGWSSFSRAIPGDVFHLSRLPLP